MIVALIVFSVLVLWLTVPVQAVLDGKEGLTTVDNESTGGSLLGDLSTIDLSTIDLSEIGLSDIESPSIESPSIEFSSKPTGIAIALLMRKPVDLPLWLDHHRELGITKFFIRLEDTPGWKSFLDAQKDIVYETAESDRENNYETLQKRQVEFVNKSLDKCRKNYPDIGWLFHIDSDELLEGDLSIIKKLPPNIKTVKLQNAEAILDGTEKTCFDAKQFLKCGKRAPCRSYVNGKAGGRVEPDVKLSGPHDFSYKGNHQGEHLENIAFEKLNVLHFDSCSFGAWSEKFQHLSKTKSKDAIPFQYYKKSIDATARAYDLYKQQVMPDAKKFDDTLLYMRMNAENRDN